MLQLRWMAAILIAAGTLFGQVNTATLVGTVKDTSGGVIPAAQVGARHTGTGVSYSATTAANGDYILDRLPIGEYILSAAMQGFKTIERRGIRLDATERAKVDLVLEVGTVTENVTVTAGAPLVSTQTTELGAVIGEQQVRNLPLNGRNFAQLISLQAGTVRSGGGIYFNGLTRDGVNVAVDGTDASNPDRPSTQDFGGQTQQNILSVEHISEFKMTTGTFSAETGRALSGAVNVITKSGTNEFHGTIYEFIRNDKLDARNFFGSERDKLRMNQFGATAAGPVRRNKLFFFAGWEGVRERRSRQISGEVPSETMRQQIRQRNPRLIPWLEILPPATSATRDPNVGFHRRSDVDTNREDSATARLDYHPRATDLFFFRYTILDADAVAASLAPTNGLIYPTQNRSGTASWTRTLTPRAINELRAGANKQDIPRVHGAFQPRGIPQLRGVFNTDLVKLLRANGGSWSILDNLSYNVGRHSVKAGFELRRFHYGRAEWQNPIYTVNSIDDLLAGRFTQVILTAGSDTKRMQENHWGFYLQDDLRVSSPLTLNLGLRYEYYSPTSERENSLFNVVDVWYGAWREPGKPILERDRNNFGPRFGLSWDIGGRSKDVIRAGVGVYYAPNALRELTTMVEPPDRPAKITLTRADGDFPMPMDETAFFADIGSVPAPAGRLVFDPFARSSYSVQWSFNYQRALVQDLALQVGYVANRGVKNKDLWFPNEINPATGRRPLPALGRVRQMENSDMSVYHSMQASLRKRFSRGFQLNGHYTYGKNISIGGVDNFTNSQSPRVQDHENRRASRGRSDADLTHIFTLDYAWDLPFHKWLGTDSGAVHKLASGWQIMGITSARSGFPMYITSGRDNRGNGDSQAQRPDAVAGVNPKVSGFRESNDHRFLDPAAFADPCGARGLRRPCGLYGNLGKNVLSGPAAFNTDFSVFKNTPLSERYTLQFRTEFFNLLNHANFSAPPAARLQLSSASFGQITGASSPREIQFALKLIF
ncbi:MAG: TonB-dependent receptor [Acidobacteria bacterium]|nr:TonB-dependent receptor [Acidobacteriota bacterium]